MLLQSLLTNAAATLRAAGIDQPQSEARDLMALITGQSAAHLMAGAGGVPDADHRTFTAYVTRRAGGEPFQHIAGTTHFYGLELICDARALIPRDDSECVVDAALAVLPDRAVVRVADLGTGSGCLLAALLSSRPHVMGLGIDLSPDAAALATDNMRHLGLSARAKILNKGWADWAGWAAADLIISNPPYIASAVIDTLQVEVRAHDPHLALDGGPDGLLPYRQITQLAQQMTPGAWLVVEIGYDQRASVTALFAAAGFTAIASGTDLGGRDRWVRGQRP